VADQQERDKPSEPSPWRPLARVGREAILLIFYLGQHWLVRWTEKLTGLEHEWWARVLLALSAIYAVIGFGVITGAELVTDCWEAVAYMMRRIRGGRRRRR
jgi:hypothetical protein